MSVFTTGPRHQPWVWQVTALCFVLGLLLAASLQTVSNIRRSGTSSGRIGQPPAGDSARTETVRKLEKEIASLRESKTKLENSIAQGSEQLKALNDELQKAKMLAGLTEVYGQGIIVTLRDSQKRPPSNRTFDRVNNLIHDQDLQVVVNELFASGAEAIAIKDQRITSRTAIRCAGPIVQVNGVPISAPYQVYAIGDPNSLMNALNMPGGVLDSIRFYDPEMVRVEAKQQIVLPAYTGSTEIRYTKVQKKTHNDKESSR
jgi:uncharacterized protein YlxW (UPF0749 family)